MITRKFWPCNFFNNADGHIQDPKTVSEVFSNNITLIPMNQDKKSVTDMVRHHLYHMMKFTSCQYDEKWKRYSPRKVTGGVQNDSDVEERILYPGHITIFLKSMNIEKYHHVDQALMWNTYHRHADRVLGRCRNTSLSAIKRCIVPGEYPALCFG